ncbi:class I adenylate-forming enzyme family protein [Catellatospora chokoriensis]|uniref:Acyl-CoA synthetase n=1 Tax=Catellatospora chokoriensis TaxID=310353 RepID=A0A8J3JV94_9ACTN|nr:fatty acid--CoA ligase family protein [Catellatospora chokoriensis]GIF87488.1 acyl-CoA synthetase [Catellatospora chokoriensis]
MSNSGWATGAPLTATPDWVDELLLAGDDRDVCLHFGSPVDRAGLRHAVADREDTLRRLGLARGGSVVLRLPPSLAYAANLLAAWRIGAQVALLDHRLTAYETDRALDRLRPQVVVSFSGTLPGGLRAFYEVADIAEARDGRPAETGHAVVQLSSGSTGPSKVIARTAAQLVAEIDRYTRMDGVPLPGERVVLLASVVHVLGLVGGLLYCLHAGVELVLPERLTVDAILRAVAAGEAPTTLLGVPFHTELLASNPNPPKLPQLKRMTTGGELVRAEVAQRFTDRYGIVLGNMYGMTEVGVIATDLFGEHRPSLLPAPGITVRELDGELLIATPASPYIGLSDPTRWVDGWLHTKDAGRVDPATGLMTVLGRLDSQVSVGGLKVDLTEVEHTLAALPGVESAVVVFDSGIEAFAVVPDPAAAAALEGELAVRLAPYKRPRVLHIVEQLPRTATGKLVRDRAVLRTADPTSAP